MGVPRAPLERFLLILRLSTSDARRDEQDSSLLVGSAGRSSMDVGRTAPDCALVDKKAGEK
jgi:hypothetical protein